MMKNTISKYFTTWWIPIISYSIPITVFFIGMWLQRDFVVEIAGILLGLNLLGCFFSILVLFFVKKWYFTFPILLVSGILFYYSALIMTFAPPDFFAVHKTIPENIDFLQPVNKEPTFSYTTPKLVLQNSGQGGQFSYYTNVKPRESGYFYIKAFEVTSEYPLSVDRIKQKSKVFVHLQENPIYSGEFTIYEGEWEQYYGARIELWFQPKNDSKEYKLLQEYYIVDGWMR